MIRMSINNVFSWFLVAGMLLDQQSDAQGLPFSISGKPIDLSLRREVARTIDRGNQWLMDHQDPSGFWSDSNHLAVTAYALMALQRDPEEYHREKKEPLLAIGYQFLRSCVQEDGGIYRQGARSSLDTAASILAMMLPQDEELDAIILNGRQFLIDEMSAFQHSFKNASGFRNELRQQQLLHTPPLPILMRSIEALRLTRPIVEVSAANSQDSHHDFLVRLVEQYQFGSARNAGVNESRTNPKDLHGGFSGSLMGADSKNPAGCYSFAGLLSYLYLDLESSDSRIEAAKEWLNQNFALSENPGSGQRDLLAYYLSMAKAWTALGVHEIKSGEQAPKDWRHDLALQLMNLQQGDGSWRDKTVEGLEQDPALATSYALITLGILYPGL